MFEFSSWLRKVFADSYHGFNFIAWLKRAFRARRVTSPIHHHAKPWTRPRVELLEDRLAPSANIDTGGTIHLPFTGTVTEGTAVASGTTLFEFTDHGGASVSA